MKKELNHHHASVKEICVDLHHYYVFESFVERMGLFTRNCLKMSETKHVKLGDLHVLSGCLIDNHSTSLFSVSIFNIVNSLDCTEKNYMIVKNIMSSSADLNNPLCSQTV